MLDGRRWTVQLLFGDGVVMLGLENKLCQEIWGQLMGQVLCGSGSFEGSLTICSRKKITGRYQNLLNRQLLTEIQ